MKGWREKRKKGLGMERRREKREDGWKTRRGEKEGWSMARWRRRERMVEWKTEGRRRGKG